MTKNQKIMNDIQDHKDEQRRRWNALRAGHGNRTGTGIFPSSRRNCKITVKQLLELKEYKKLKWTNVSIQQKLKLSEYIVRLALDGHYDHILPSD